MGRKKYCSSVPRSSPLILPDATFVQHRVACCPDGAQDAQCLIFSPCFRGYYPLFLAISLFPLLPHPTPVEWLSNPSLPSVLDFSLSLSIFLFTYSLLPLFSPLLLTITLPAHLFLKLRLHADLTQTPKAQGIHTKWYKKKMGQYL